MDRRAFLIGAGALVLTGCAQARPATTESPSPNPTASSAPLLIGVDDTTVGRVLGQLLSGSLGGSASAQMMGSDWNAILGGGTLSAAAVYGGTAWNQLSNSEDPSDNLVQDLADLTDPEITVMNPGQTDGGLVWMTSAQSGVGTLEGLGPWSTGKAAAIPSWANERADGLLGVNAIYGTAFVPSVQDDPVARAQLLVAGKAGVGAFRRTEYYGEVDLVELVDPEKMMTTDPVLLMVNSAFANADPDTVLRLTSVMDKLTNEALIDIQKQISQGTTQAAQSWLTANGLA
ncbi:MAG: hypothetical protein K4304_00360 [Propionicimonas sp.]